GAATPPCLPVSGNNVAATATYQATAVSTTTSLGSGSNPSVYGDAVTLSATVSPTSGSSTPTGSVTFKDGTTTLCNAVALSGGTATCTTPALASGTLLPGSHALTAAYSP